MVKGLLRVVAVVVVMLAVHQSVRSGWPLRIHDVCGIPCYDYQNRELSPAAVGTTFSGLPLTAVGVATPTPPAGSTSETQQITPATIRVFQLQNPPLKINQCQITNVVVHLERIGTCVKSVITYQGTQSQTLVDPKNVPAIANIRRNLFYIHVSALAAATPPPAGPLAGVAVPPPPPGPAPSVAVPTPGVSVPSVAAPPLFTIEAVPQWFKKGETKTVRLEGPPVPDLAKYFDLVDRLQIEFRYE
jgi:hypothetical protein